MEATPRPWEAYSGHDGGLGHTMILAFKPEIWGDVPRLVIAKMGDAWHGESSDEAKANAALIVKAVNAHDKLVEAAQVIYNFNVFNDQFCFTCDSSNVAPVKHKEQCRFGPLQAALKLAKGA